MWCMPHGNSLRVQLGPCKTCFHIPNSWPPLYLLEETSTHNLPGNGITPGNNHHLRSTSKSVSTMKLEPIPSCIVSNLLIVIPMDQTCGDFAFGKLFAKKDNPMLASFVPTEGTDFHPIQAYQPFDLFPYPIWIPNNPETCGGPKLIQLTPPHFQDIRGVLDESYPSLEC